MEFLIKQALEALQSVPEKYQEIAFPLLLNHVLTKERVILMRQPKKPLEK
jgi:hypothetical protein